MECGAHPLVHDHIIVRIFQVFYRVLVGDFESCAALLKLHSHYEQDVGPRDLVALIRQLDTTMLHDKESCTAFVTVQKVRNCPGSVAQGTCVKRVSVEE